MTDSAAKRSDFAFIFTQHIEENGGIDSIVSRLPSDASAPGMISGIYKHAQKYGRLSYSQYFMGIGTLYHYEIIGE